MAGGGPAAEKAYQVVKDFWPSVGLKLELDQPAAGHRGDGLAGKAPKVPTGLIQRTLNLVLESVTSTGEKDQYRTRIERTPTDTSEIFITHRGLEEVYSSNDKVSTVWQPRPRDPELEAEMLQRLLLRFEAGEAASVAKTSPDKPVVGKDAGTTLPTISHVVKDGAESRLEVDEPFDRAWRRVGWRWTVADSPSRTGTAPKGCTSCVTWIRTTRASNARVAA